MNKKQRKSLAEAVEWMESAREVILAIAEEESDKFYNLPEGLNATENSKRIEQAAEDLDQAQQNLEEVIDAVQETLNNL